MSIIVERILNLIRVLRSGLFAPSAYIDTDSIYDTGYLGTPVKNGWQIEVGHIQLNLRSVKDIGWEVYAWDHNTTAKVGHPTFFPTLDMAYQRYAYLQKFYNVRLAQPRRLMKEAVRHG